MKKETIDNLKKSIEEIIKVVKEDDTINFGNPYSRGELLGWLKGVIEVKLDGMY